MKKKIWMALAIILMSTVAFKAFAAGETGGVVNVNTASKEELLLLPGIGEARAEAIIAERQKKPFAFVEDLLVIRGIGEKMLEKMKPFVVVKGETTIKAE